MPCSPGVGEAIGTSNAAGRDVSRSPFATLPFGMAPEAACGPTAELAGGSGWEGTSLMSPKPRKSLQGSKSWSAQVRGTVQVLSASTSKARTKVLGNVAVLFARYHTVERLRRDERACLSHSLPAMVSMQT